ncbi:ABC transporter ATP-binding protein [Kocuria sp. LUK]|uniref:ABC transporter ATP-binding protein n=1 Tax=Kocuria TaxID=57493 RepID=UPI000C7A30AC|nr:MULTISPECIES: ABC transporter ATP-binding protein [Kocuria]MCD1144707.1 ABC transporter ATP-binding protein [Kocuria sp. LUK]
MVPAPAPPSAAPAGARPPALELAGVDLLHPDGTDAAGRPRTVRALDGVDLTARAGTVTALVGPSGSGKSSLLAVAAALVRPTAGSVRLDGQELTGLPEPELARVRRTRIGVVFQQPNLLPSLTALEQLVLTAHVRGARGARLAGARERAAGLLELVGLSAAAGRRPHQLSGGQRQRVNIARALMARPRVLLADEPTAALDRERAREITELLVAATRRFGTATVLVTHDPGLVPLADRCATVLDGRLRLGPAPADRGPDGDQAARSSSTITS